MKVRQHKNSTYSITDLTRTDLIDIEASIYMRFADFFKSTEATFVPSGYPGWTLESYRSISKDIAERHFEMFQILQSVVRPPHPTEE